MSNKFEKYNEALKGYEKYTGINFYFDNNSILKKLSEDEKLKKTDDEEFKKLFPASGEIMIEGKKITLLSKEDFKVVTPTALIKITKNPTKQNNNKELIKGLYTKLTTGGKISELPKEVKKKLDLISDEDLKNKLKEFKSKYKDGDYFAESNIENYIKKRNKFLARRNFNNVADFLEYLEENFENSEEKEIDRYLRLAAIEADYYNTGYFDGKLDILLKSFLFDIIEEKITNKAGKEETIIKIENLKYMDDTKSDDVKNAVGSLSENETKMPVAKQKENNEKDQKVIKANKVSDIEIEKIIKILRNKKIITSQNQYEKIGILKTHLIDEKNKNTVKNLLKKNKDVLITNYFSKTFNDETNKK